MFVANSGKDVALADIQELYVNGLREDREDRSAPCCSFSIPKEHDLFRSFDTDYVAKHLVWIISELLVR